MSSKQEILYKFFAVASQSYVSTFIKMLNFSLQVDRVTLVNRHEDNLALEENWKELYGGDSILEPLKDVYLSVTNDFTGANEGLENDDGRMLEAKTKIFLMTRGPQIERLCCTHPLSGGLTRDLNTLLAIFKRLSNDKQMTALSYKSLGAARWRIPARFHTCGAEGSDSKRGDYTRQSFDQSTLDYNAELLPQVFESDFEARIFNQ
jgi:hypothetical protein